MTRPAAVHRPSTGIRHLVAEAAERGVDAESALLGTSLTPVALTDPAQLVTVGQEIAVAHNVAAALPGHEGVGLAVGRRLHLAALGPIGVALLNCGTPQELLRVTERYGALLPGLSRLSVSVDDDELLVQLDGSHLAAPAGDLLVERDLATLVQALRQSTGTTRPIREIRVGFPASTTPEWLEFCGRPPLPSTGVTSCLLDRRLLESSLPPGDSHAAVDALAACEALLSRHLQPSSISTLVLGRLHGSGSQLPTFEQVAALLTTSTRTLHRRLADEHTSFRELRERVLVKRALEMLGSGRLTVQQVAERLGYSDTSAFTHAFRRWTGASPRAFVRRQWPTTWSSHNE